MKPLAVHSLLILAGVASVIATLKLNRLGEIFLSVSIIFVICCIGALITCRAIDGKHIQAAIVYTVGVALGEISSYLYWYFNYAIKDPVASQASLGISVSVIEAFYICFIGVASLILVYKVEKYVINKLRNA